MTLRTIDHGKWTSYQKYWILKKISHFYHNDTCFRFFNTQSMLAGFQAALSKSDDLQSLEKQLRLQGLGAERTFFFRKKTDNGAPLFFEFPSLYFQVYSIVIAWDTIAAFQYENENLDKAIENQESEQLSGSDIDADQLDTKRSCFGSKANYSIVWSQAGIKRARVRDHERNLGFPLALQFQYEYESFRLKAMNTIQSTVDASNGAYFFQSDVKSFYHSVTLDFMYKFLDHTLLEPVRSLLPFLMANGFQSLPTGWILSGFLANFLLLEFHKRCEGLVAGGLLWQSISYVDDFIFIAPSRSKLEDNPYPDLETVLTQKMSELTDGLLSFHLGESHKARRAFFDKKSLPRLQRYFFTMGVSQPKEAIDFGFGIDEVFVDTLSPDEPNEKSGIWQRIRNARRALVRGEPLSRDHRRSLLCWLNEKVKEQEGRYIASALFLLKDIVDHGNQYGLEDGESVPSLKDDLQGWCKELFEDCFAQDVAWPVLGSFLTAISRISLSLDWGLELPWFFFNKGFHIAEKESDYPELRGLLNLLTWEMVRESQKYSTRNTGLSLPLQMGDSSKRMRGQFTDQIAALNALAISIVYKFSDVGLVDHRMDNAIAISTGFLVRDLYVNNEQDFPFQELLQRAALFTGANQRLFLVYAGIGAVEALSKADMDSLLGRIVSTSARGWGTYGRSYLHALRKIMPALEELTHSNERKRLLFLREHLRTQKSDIMIFLNRYVGKKSERFFLLTCFCICVSINDIVFYLLIKMLPLEGQQWMPWRSRFARFQQTGHRMVEILQRVYEMEVSPDRSGFSNDVEGAVLTLVQRYLDEDKGEAEADVTGIYPLQVVIDPGPSPDDEGRALFIRPPSGPIKVTVAPIAYDLGALEGKTAYRFTKSEMVRSLDFRLRMAIDEAIHHKASILIVPEMTVPNRYLEKYLQQLSRAGIVFIAGLEYRVLPDRGVQNVTIVSLPVRRSINPLGRSYLVFEQVKNFPSAIEAEYLRQAKWEYQSKKTLYWFASAQLSNFAVLTCSDFLSLSLRFLLQGRIQCLFVPTQNQDASTYRVLADASIRDLHAISLVCSNGKLADSFCIAPYYLRQKRILFSHQGESEPTAHTFLVDPGPIKTVQDLRRGDIPFRGNGCTGGLAEPFKNHKQLPPDWALTLRRLD